MIDPPLVALFFLSGAQTQQARKPPALIPAESKNAKQAADVTAGFWNGVNLDIIDINVSRRIVRAAETKLEIEGGLVVNGVVVRQIGSDQVISIVRYRTKVDVAEISPGGPVGAISEGQPRE